MSRCWIFVVALFVAFVSASSPGAMAQGAEPLDTRTLPRIEGATLPFAGSANGTAFDLPQPLLQTHADAVTALLVANGWRVHTHPTSGRSTTSDTVIIRTLKKGPHGLRLIAGFTTKDAQAVRITYEARPLAHNLPFPDNATEIAYDPEKPQLRAVVAQPSDVLGTQMFRAMAEAGWERVAKPDRTSRQTFTKPGSPPVWFYIAKRIDGTSHLSIYPAEVRDPADDPKPTARAAPPANPVADMKALLEFAKQQTAEAEKAARERGPPAAKTPPAPRAGEAPLVASTLSIGAPIPVPDTADELTFDSGAGKLEFKTRSSLFALSAFYTTEMKRLGWKQEKTVINSERMVSLDFNKGRGKDISFTLMARNDHATVSARGRGLITAPAAPPPVPSASTERPPPTAPSGPPAEQVSGDKLTASDQRGLIVPAPNQSAGSERTPYRQEVTAQVPASVADILAFYRRELIARGWSEAAGGPPVSETSARLTFTSPDGPAVLTLERTAAAGLTTTSLTVRKEAKARQDGILPAPGKAKLVLGNMEDVAATVTVAGKTIKVAGGVGAQEPNGPKLELPPGSHKVTIKLGNGAAKSETIVLKADTVWGMIIGPRGALTLPLY